MHSLDLFPFGPYFSRSVEYAMVTNRYVGECHSEGVCVCDNVHSTDHEFNIYSIAL
jgi:hypothetical protein